MNAEQMRAAILGSDDLPKEPVDVPWDLGGDKLYVRAMTADEKDAYLVQTMPTGDFRWTGNLTASLVVKVLVNEDGERVFSDADAKVLGQKNSAALSSLFKVALRLSGLSEEGAEQIEADFGVAQSEGSASG